MKDNLTRQYPKDFMATWAGCTHLDCLPECRHGLESGYCERLQRAWKAWCCSSCDGEGFEVDYVGLEMKPIQVGCSACKGTGRAHTAGERE